jgi:DNA-binding PadR family transcriptional regulator
MRVASDRLIEAPRKKDARRSRRFSITELGKQALKQDVELIS